MTKSNKLLLGIVSALPLVLTGIYLITFFNFFITSFRHMHTQQEFPEIMLEHMGWIIGVALLMTFAKLGMLIYFIIHSLNNRAVIASERVVWILVFIFAGSIGFPIYWYMRIWNDEPQLHSTG